MPNLKIAAMGALLVLMMSRSAFAQNCMMWVRRNNQDPNDGVGTPGQRAYHAMAYDRDRRVTVFFGGEIGKSGDESYFNDTWEYDGNHWKQIITPGELPVARSHHAMAYYPELKRVIVYGGYAGGKYGFNDTWAFHSDGTTGTWVRLAGDPSDIGYVSAGLIYDSSARRILRAGGHEEPFESDTFTVPDLNGNLQELSSGAWSEINKMLLNWAMGTVYDSHRGVLMVIGGYSESLDLGHVEHGEDWEFGPDGVWRLGPAIAPRVFPAAAYDSVRGRAVVVGGFHSTLPAEYEAYELDSAHPERGWLPDTPLPAPWSRFGAAMVFDQSRGVMVLMGGVGAAAENDVPGEGVKRGVGSRFSDTWELVPAPPAQFIAPPVTTFCRDQQLFLAPTTISPFQLTFEWFWDGGRPGFASIAIPGQTNLTLVLPPLVGFQLDARGVLVPDPQLGDRKFTLVVRDPCGNESAQTFGVAVHNAPTILPNVFIQPDHVDKSDSETKFVRCPGDTITLTLPIDSSSVVFDQATPEYPVTYVWYHDSKPIVVDDPLFQDRTIIADKNTLRLENLHLSDSGAYRLAISNQCGQSLSLAVILQVGPKVLQNPADVEAKVCDGAIFQIAAEGYGKLQYQWRLDGAPLPQGDPHFSGANEATLRINPLLYSHEGRYDAVVWDECGLINAVTSKVAKLTIKPGPQWVLRATNGPVARTFPGLAYDSRRHVTVLFGGITLDPADVNLPISLNDLWEWDGARWIQRMTNNLAGSWFQDKNGYWRPNYAASQPPPRQKFGMAYDNRRGRVVLFGGESFDPGIGQNFLNDLWEWDGTRWYFRATNGPSPRMLTAMAYDTDRGVSVLYGGAPIPDSGTVSEWDGKAWSSHVPDSGPVKNYYQTEGALVYDSFHHYTFFGPAVDGFFSLPFFSWDGTSWSDRGNRTTPAFTLVEGAMAYDSYRRRSVWFGGRNNGGTVPSLTAIWDGFEWSLQSDLPDAPPPPLRFGNALAYDSVRHATVLFGGEGNYNGAAHNLSKNETWELIAVDTPLINEQPVSQYRRLGDAAVFHVAAVGPPGTALSYQWYQNDQLITDDHGGNILGLGTPTLAIQSTSNADSGAYYVEVGGDCGKTKSLLARLTLEPNLQIFSALDTTTLIWSDANVVLEQADTPSGPWFVVPGATSPFDPAKVGPAKFFRIRPPH